MRVAAVDIGSNTLLLLVADERDGELVRVRDECRFGRLGQGLDATGQLTPEAVERSLAILREYRDLLDAAGADRVVAAGTEALRRAVNASAFLEPAAEILAAPIEVVSGEREAALVGLAVARSLPDLAATDHAIADVGGGSTEVVVVAGGEVRARTSTPIGAVRLSERHLRSDPPGKDEAQALIADIDRALSGLELPTGVPLVASAGTATTLAAVSLALRDYDPDRVHGLALPRGEVERQLARYLELTVAEKKRIPGMEAARADVIAAGCAIYARLLHRIGSAEMIVSDRGVRWGLAYEAAGA